MPGSFFSFGDVRLWLCVQSLQVLASHLPSTKWRNGAPGPCAGTCNTNGQLCLTGQQLLQRKFFHKTLPVKLSITLTHLEALNTSLGS